MKIYLRRQVHTWLMILVLAAAADGQQTGGNLSGEKIYIHYDKDYYVAGETIWFKAYLFNNNKPDGGANNFYLQLFDATGKLYTTKKYPVKGATVKGDLELPDSLKQGYYTVRALTPAMLGENEGNVYQKNIYVFNPSSPPPPAVQNPGKGLSLQFFPESGYLADGILMYTGFKATDSLGLPAEVSGYIKTDDTVTVAPFRTQHDGMGKVQFRPIAGKKYVAVTTLNGHPVIYPLPEVQATGINLKIEDEKGGKLFVLNRTWKGKQNYSKVTLVAEMEQGIVYENEINFDNYLVVKGHIITDSLPSGLLRFTVLNKDGVPLAERLSFVNNGEYKSPVSAEIEKKGTEPREENIIRLAFPEQIQHSCSVSVTTLQGNGNSGDNILSSLVLTSELRGYIHHPGWYFEDTGSIRKQALDNLLMIQGWSRIKHIKNKNTAEVTAPEDKYLINITGYLQDSKTKGPLSGGRLAVFMESADSINYNYDVAVDANGKFLLDSLLFRGETKFYYAYTSEKGKEISADIFLQAISADTLIEKLPLTQKEFITLPQFYSASDEIMIGKRYLTQSPKLEETKTLDPVSVKSTGFKRPLEEVNEKYSKGVFTALGKMNFDNINQPENNRTLSVYDFVKRSINHVFVQDDKFVNRKNFSLFRPMSGDEFAKKEKKIDSINGNKGPAGAGDVLPINDPNFREPGKNFEVAVFLNESVVFPGLLKTITMDEVALIKFYDPGFVGAGGTDGPGGAIAVYTKKNISPPGKLEKLDHVTYNGYAIEKEFYSPDYSNPAVDRSTPDNRTTLYWSGDIYAGGATQTIPVRFFNSDVSRRMKLVLEGFDANGRLVHVEKIIE